MILAEDVMKDLGENEKEAKMGVRLIIMRKVKWTLIEFADLHGERHGPKIKGALGGGRLEDSRKADADQTASSLLVRP
jgi:hypothetical protein